MNPRSRMTMVMIGRSPGHNGCGTIRGRPSPGWRVRPAIPPCPHRGMLPAASPLSGRSRDGAPGGRAGTSWPSHRRNSGPLVGPDERDPDLRLHGFQMDMPGKADYKRAGQFNRCFHLEFTQAHVPCGLPAVD